MPGSGQAPHVAGVAGRGRPSSLEVETPTAKPTTKRSNEIDLKGSDGIRWDAVGDVREAPLERERERDSIDPKANVLYINDHKIS